MLERLLAEAATADLTAMDYKLTTDDYRRRVDDVRLEVESEIRRRLVADRGAEAVASTLRRPLPEDVDFLNASQEAAGGHPPVAPAAEQEAGSAAGA